MVAAGIAKGSWVKTANYAMKLGAVAFCLPYFMVLHPALVGRDTPVQVALAAGTGLLGAVTMAYGLFGWSASRLNPVLRVLFFAGGAMMLFPGIEVTLAGMAVSRGHAGGEPDDPVRRTGRRFERPGVISRRSSMTTRGAGGVDVRP